MSEHEPLYPVMVGSFTGTMLADPVDGICDRTPMTMLMTIRFDGSVHVSCFRGESRRRFTAFTLPAGTGDAIRDDLFKPTSKRTRRKRS